MLSTPVQQVSRCVRRSLRCAAGLPRKVAHRHVQASEQQAKSHCLYLDGGCYLLTWSAVDMAKINESLRMEEEGNQQEMRRLITQRDNRVRAESFRQQLDDLQASEAAALQRVRSGRMAMQMAPQPQQLLLEYAQARVAELSCGPHSINALNSINALIRQKQRTRGLEDSADREN